MPECNTPIPDDICFSIMAFLDAKTILKSCITISWQWYKISASLEHSLTLYPRKKESPIGTKLSNCLILCKLREIHLIMMSGSSITHDQLSIIFGSEKTRYLKVLELVNCPLTTVDCKQIAKSEFAAHLVTLKLQNCHIGSASLLELVECNNFPNLTSLDLCHNPQIQGWQYLLAEDGSTSIIKQLKELRLNDCGLGPNAFLHIKSKFPNLEKFIDVYGGCVYVKTLVGKIYEFPITSSEMKYSDLPPLLYDKGEFFDRFACLFSKKLVTDDPVVPGAMVHGVIRL
ncbi:hypothetical protein C9374_002799 [Naegleria lovaniensis]|uniref:F-box domain-containing protein n=1 Tax=Naegleria lovaniensis TaxID=51637 RepID=A0AA88GUR8_NAELO|nr:uncharacterized protein C9374_002799 [Naegleria lovaniensis]KAG2386353.1 hypothetical protein C9374_002799 [Naegleria lovaniensis]